MSDESYICAIENNSSRGYGLVVYESDMEQLHLVNPLRVAEIAGFREAAWIVHRAMHRGMRWVMRGVDWG